MMEGVQVQVKEMGFRLLGAEHPDTLSSMSDLVFTHLDQGQWKETVELHVQVKNAHLRPLEA